MTDLIPNSLQSSIGQLDKLQTVVLKENCLSTDGDLDFGIFARMINLSKSYYRLGISLFLIKI